MSHRITFQETGRKTSAIWQWTDIEQQSRHWKHCPVILNEIIIKATGRNQNAVNYPGGRFGENIIYTVYDYGILFQKKRNPLEVVVIFKNNIAVDVVIPKSKRYQMRYTTGDLLAAILLTDKHYAGSNGIAYGKPCLHQNKTLIKKLLRELRSEFQRNKRPL